MASPLDAMLRGLAEMVAPMVTKLLAAADRLPGIEEEVRDAWVGDPDGRLPLLLPATPANHWPRCTRHNDDQAAELGTAPVQCGRVAFHSGLHDSGAQDNLIGYRWR